MTVTLQSLQGPRGCSTSLLFLCVYAGSRRPHGRNKPHEIHTPGLILLPPGSTQAILTSEQRYPPQWYTHPFLQLRLPVAVISIVLLFAVHHRQKIYRRHHMLPARLRWLPYRSSAPHGYFHPL